MTVYSKWVVGVFLSPDLLDIEAITQHLQDGLQRQIDTVHARTRCPQAQLLATQDVNHQILDLGVGVRGQPVQEMMRCGAQVRVWHCASQEAIARPPNMDNTTKLRLNGKT